MSDFLFFLLFWAVPVATFSAVSFAAGLIYGQWSECKRHIEEEVWREYRDLVYPQGMPAQQNLECHQAFFSGALEMMILTAQIDAMPGEEADKAMQQIAREVREVCRVRIETLKNRN
jgi:viroplasmin and RNaseH domain-containing protein